MYNSRLVIGLPASHLSAPHDDRARQAIVQVALDGRATAAFHIRVWRILLQKSVERAAKRDFVVFDLMLPIFFKPLLEYLRRCSPVSFGKLLERKRGGYTHNIGINGL
jgi:hypothetical protein